MGMKPRTDTDEHGQMRNISFALTTKQVRHGFRTGEILKDVTRRLGWADALPGCKLSACEKCQGLGKGGKIVRLGTIELVTVRRERLDRLTKRRGYGEVEVIREGFPDMTPAQFVEMFCDHNKCLPETVVTRLEFKYLIKPVARAPLNPIEAKACCACRHFAPIDEGARGRCAVHPKAMVGAHCTCLHFSPSL